MKNIYLSAAILFSALTSHCGCPAVTASIFHSGATANDYTLAIYLTKNIETFHIQDFIYCDGTQVAYGCNTFEENGTVYIEFNCKGTPTAKVNVYTQSCSNSTGLCATILTSLVEGNLPVVVSDFFLQRNTNNVIINWQTQQEVNSDRFEIERSFDNKLFQTVGTVASHGNSNLVNNYSYTAKTETGNPSFFRIKLIDKDGSVSFTPIKSIKGYTVNTAYTLFPNPCFGSGKVTIRGLNEPAIVQVMDNSGKLIKSFTPSGNNVIEIGTLQNGVYIVRITGNGSKETTIRKLTIIN